MEMVYIIGPLTTHGELGKNIEYAEKLAAVLMACGYAPIWTHSLARVPGATGVIPPSVALDACRHLMLAQFREGEWYHVAVIEGFEESAGSMLELEALTRCANFYGRAVNVYHHNGLPFGRRLICSWFRPRSDTMAVLRAMAWTHEAIDAAWDEIVRGIATKEGE